MQVFNMIMKKASIVRASDLDCLAYFTIFLKDESRIDLYEALDNLWTALKKLDPEMLVDNKWAKEDAKIYMDDIAPGYDPELFKNYHAKKIISIFIYLNTMTEGIFFKEPEETKKEKDE